MTRDARHTADGIRLLVRLLMTDLRGVDPVAVSPGLWAEPVRGWLTAGAALAGGEPKRALAVLDDPEPEKTYDDLVTRTLRTAATVMDVNWSPGGTVGWALPAQDESALLKALDGTHGRLTVLARDPGLRLAAFLAARYLPDLLVARAVLGNGEILDAQPPDVLAAVGGAEEVGEAVRWFDEMPREIAEGGLAGPVAYHLLVAADVRARAGDRRRGEASRQAALRLVPGDPAFAAMASLLAGDAELGTPGASERRLPLPAGPRTLDRAARHFADADALFGEAGADRGRAAAVLRLAHVARLRRKPDDRAACVERALTLATAAGDRAGVVLLKVHRLLDAVEDGRPVPVGDVAEVRRWAATVGSGSWLRGMAHLVAARAADWTRESHLARAGEAADLAQRLMEPIPATAVEPVPSAATESAPAAAVEPVAPTAAEPVLPVAAEPVPPAAAERSVPRTVHPTTAPRTSPVGAYHEVRHRLASLVLADISLRARERQLEDRYREVVDQREAVDGRGGRVDAVRGGMSVPTVNAWLSTAVAAELFLNEAVGLCDPDLVAAARPRLVRVIGLGERLLGGQGGGPTAVARALCDTLDGLRAGLDSTHVVEKLHRLRRHRSAGLSAAAERTAREAQALVEHGVPSSVARCALLLELGRAREARDEADRLEARGALTAVQSAALRLRLGQPERAAEAERRIGEDGVEPEKPWDRPAIAAEALLALGDPRRAAERALEAVSVYEEHRSRMGRDTLRAASADDPVVARAYHTALLAQWELPGAKASTFATAERARSGFLDTLHALDTVHALDNVHALDTAAGRAAAQRAVRGWLQAEARWAARFEEAAAALRGGGGAPRAGHPPAERMGVADERATERGLTEAEQALAAAAAEVRRIAPGALTALRAPGALTAPRGPAALTAPRGPDALTAPREPGALAAPREPGALTAPRGPGVVPDATALARALPPDTVLLQYHLHDQDLVGWALTRDGLLADRRRRSADGLVATARRFHAACASGADATEHGRMLSEALLGFCAPLLSRCRNVVVVPPASLSLVPFHALPVGSTVLGLTHDVSYLPAVSLLTRPGRRSPEPDWRGATALLVGAPATAPERRLAYLPGTLAEVAAVERLLPRSRVLTGLDADRASVLAQAAGRSVLHLATHGDIQELTPYLSRLALAGRDHLGVDDLLSPDLTPDLLVLSACETGRGTATAGGEVLGLTRTAVISGARHAVVSLWPVDDVTGCLVITRMYRHLTSADRVTVGAALARAQREVHAASPEERAEEYAQLAQLAQPTEGVEGVEGVDGPAEPTGRRVRARDSGPRPAAAVTDPHHPFHWAPFIHVGV
ncbi:CHAT domain-containing protein [Streptomyces tauricus]|uniref:CHAT domain-containing protein n=1 Tax=Streptomyces tauricus TaxID=68274 RepID=UPI00224452F4|nr:CHAT domain-containing protein [Streptomyces tauricus]MCW8102456.1 CHAT domain-containing protein [Streptomyces tauricus]